MKSTLAQSYLPKPSDRGSEPQYRVDIEDVGVVLRSGDGPDSCDRYGAREASLFRDGDRWYLFYDGAGEDGWKACLAESTDLVNWTKLGAVLPLGQGREIDSACAASPWVIKEGDLWHMFYLGSPNASPAPERVPQFPYLTLKATAQSPRGPWIKDHSFIPFTTRPDSWMESTASPGYIVRHNGEYIQYFSGSIEINNGKAPWAERTLGIAKTKDLNLPWEVQEEPILPLEEQIENSSIYYEEESKTWFLFTNHIGMEDHPEHGLIEYTDSIWVYWTKDPMKWNPKDKAVVIDGLNCSWSYRCIGMPSVARVGNRLAVLYDAPEGESTDHNYRHIGLAWVKLPIIKE